MIYSAEFNQKTEKSLRKYPQVVCTDCALVFLSYSGALIYETHKSIKILKYFTP